VHLGDRSSKVVQVPQVKDLVLSTEHLTLIAGAILLLDQLVPVLFLLDRSLDFLAELGVGVDVFLDLVRVQFQVATEGLRQVLDFVSELHGKVGQ